MPSPWPGTTRNLTGATPSALLSDLIGPSGLTHSGHHQAIGEELLALQLHIGDTGAAAPYASIKARLDALTNLAPVSTVTATQLFPATVGTSWTPISTAFTLPPNLATYRTEVCLSGTTTSTDATKRVKIGILFQEGTSDLIHEVGPIALGTVDQPLRSSLMGQHTAEWGATGTGTGIIVARNDSGSWSIAVTETIVIRFWNATPS